MIDVTDPSQAQPSGHRPVLVKWSTRRRTRVIDGRRASGARDANTARVMCDGLTLTGRHGERPKTWRARSAAELHPPYSPNVDRVPMHSTGRPARLTVTARRL